MPSITKEQKSTLESLKVERLSSNPDNLRLVEHFSSRNGNLAAALKSDAFEDDANGRIAYYLVKNALGDILFYFSLKCGQLYDYFIQEHQLDLLKKLMIYFQDVISDESTTEDDRRLIEKIREDIRTQKGFSKTELKNIKKSEQIVRDVEQAIDDNLQRVGQTFAGVELVQFSKNEACKAYIDSLNFSRRFGEIVFWYYVVPIIEEVTKLVGCRYVFLFAADSTPDQELVNYYRDLQFSDDKEHSAAMPLYDLMCRFMYQEVGTLGQNREKFLNAFNPGEEDV